MATLHIKSLHCFETEDNTGDDECELRIWGNSLDKLRQDMNNGDTWDIDRTFEFTDRVKIGLWDLDAGNWIDGHDHLGTVVIRRYEVDNAEATFNKDGADYKMVYSVTL